MAFGVSPLARLGNSMLQQPTPDERHAMLLTGTAGPDYNVLTDEPGYSYNPLLPIRHLVPTPEQAADPNFQPQPEWAWPGIVRYPLQALEKGAEGTAGYRPPMSTDSSMIEQVTGGKIDPNLEENLLAAHLPLGVRGDPNVLSMAGRGAKRRPPLPMSYPRSYLARGIEEDLPAPPPAAGTLPRQIVYRGTEAGPNAQQAIRPMVGGDLGDGVYVTPSEDLAGSYGGGPGASVKKGTRAVHSYDMPDLPPEHVAYVHGGAKIGEDVRIVNGHGEEIYSGPWDGGTGTPGSKMEAALQQHPQIKAVVGTPESIGVNQISIRDPSILTPSGRSAIGHNLPPGGAPEEEIPPPPKKAAKSQQGTSNRPGAITSIRNMPPDQAIAAAESGAHLKQGTDGQFVGAPRGFKDMSQIEAARADFDKSVQEGIAGLHWYDQSQAANTELTGGVPARQKLLAAEEAHWSPQATPETNYGASLAAHNAYEVGAPANLVRTGQQARSYNLAREAGTLEGVGAGPKTGIFRGHLDPTAEDPTVGTNDIWHARANGFTNKDGKPFDRALTAQEHAYLDGETVLAVQRANQNKTGDYDQWTPGRIQAAGWVGKKIQFERDKILAKNAKIADPAKQISYEDAHAAAVQKSMQDFSHVMDKHTAAATYEAVPGAGTSKLATALLGGPRELREEYSADPRSAWNTAPGGRDQLYESLGLYSRPTVPATGSFTPKGTNVTEINPAQVARPQVSYRPTGGGGMELDRPSEAALRTAEGLRAYVDAQNMGAPHKLMPRGPVSGQNAISIPLNRALTPEEMQNLSAAVKPYGLVPSDTGTGVSLLNFGGYEGQPMPLPTGKDLPKRLAPGGDLGAAIRKVLPEANPSRAAQMTPSVDYEKAFSRGGRGTATRQLFKTLDQPAKGVPSLAGKLDTPELRQTVLDRLNRDEEYGQRLGAPQRQDIQNARRIMSDPHPTNGGLAGLRKALKEGKIPLPVWLGGLIGTGAAAAMLGKSGQAEAAEPKPTIRDHILGALKKQGAE